MFFRSGALKVPVLFVEVPEDSKRREDFLGDSDLVCIGLSFCVGAVLLMTEGSSEVGFLYYLK